MRRCFLAIDLPDDVRAALVVQQFLLPLPRRSDPDRLHLTLVFLGDCTDAMLTDLDAELRGLRVPGFSIALQGFGLFGGGRPRVAWAGVAPNPALLSLRRQVFGAAVRCGAMPDRRRYIPHVTLGRFPPPEPEAQMRLERAIADGAGFRLPPFPVAGITLYENRLSSKAALHLALAIYPLAGSG